jgi:hypothetical protein
MAVYAAGRIVRLAKSIVAELLVRISGAGLQLLPSRCAKTFFDVSHRKCGRCTGRPAVCSGSHSSGQCGGMLANRLQSHCQHNRGFGGTLLICGFPHALLCGRSLLHAVGASCRRSFHKYTSTRHVGVNSSGHRRIGTRSLLDRRSTVRTTIDQNTTGAKFPQRSLRFTFLKDRILRLAKRSTRQLPVRGFAYLFRRNILVTSG